MTVKDLIDSNLFELICEGPDTSAPVDGVFCCDLLSIAMGRGKPDHAWVTVMGNINSLAVLRLTDMSCIVLAEGAALDDEAKEKAAQVGTTVLRSKEPVFETALKIHGLIK